MAQPNFGLLDNALVNKNRALEGYGAANALIAQGLENQQNQMAIENALIERAAGQAGGGDLGKTAQLLTMGGRVKEGAALTKAGGRFRRWVRKLLKMPLLIPDSHWKV